MTLQDIIGGIVSPGMPYGDDAAPAVTALAVVNANTEAGAAIFQIPKSGNIKKAYFVVTTLTTSGDVEVRLETVSGTNGNPTGTLYHANATVTITVSATGEQTATFATAFAVAQGDVVALVIIRNSGTFDGVLGLSNNWWDTGAAVALEFGYVATNVASTWTKDDLSPNVALEYDDASLGCLWWAAFFSSVTVDTWQSGTNPNRRGLRFKVPFRGRLSGFGCLINPGAASGATVIFYNSDGITATTVLTTDSEQVFAGAAVLGLRSYIFTAPVTVEANTFYRLVILPNAAVNMILHSINVGTAALLDASPGGKNFHWTQVNGAPAAEGDWAQTLTKRPLIWLVFDQLDDGAGAGGGAGRAPTVVGGAGGWW